MTQAQHPMFEGRPIQEGDEVLIPARVARVLLPAGNLDLAIGPPGEPENISRLMWWGGWPPVKGHTPAPRPLVPGPAVLDPETTYAQPVTVIAADGRRAWIRGRADAGAEIVETIRLRNTEGAAS